MVFNIIFDGCLILFPFGHAAWPRRRHPPSQPPCRRRCRHVEGCRRTPLSGQAAARRRPRFFKDTRGSTLGVSAEAWKTTREQHEAVKLRAGGICAKPQKRLLGSGRTWNDSCRRRVCRRRQEVEKLTVELQGARGKEQEAGRPRCMPRCRNFQRLPPLSRRFGACAKSSNALT